MQEGSGEKISKEEKSCVNNMLQHFNQDRCAPLR